MSSPLLSAVHLTRSSLMMALLTAVCLVCVDCIAQEPGSNEVGTIDEAPSQNPWANLDDMPSKLGRFVLATDQRHIYRLGGISFNIRRGGRYGHQFAAYDPSEQAWEKLPSVPLGTGSAHLTWWPAQESLVMVAGIKKLGDKFSQHAVAIGKYSIADKRWVTQSARCRDLGRIAAMIHLDENRFLLIAGDESLNAHRTAILELEVETKGSATSVVRVVGKFPQGGRIIGIAKARGTIAVLQSNAGDARLLRFSAASGEYLDQADLSTSCVWTDKLLAWQGNLLIWKNSDSSKPNTYQHASQMLLIDPVSGHCKTLHGEHRGPIARRSSDGIVVGNTFYVFGGQRDDKLWLQDAHRYQFAVESSSE